MLLFDIRLYFFCLTNSFKSFNTEIVFLSILLLVIGGIIVIKTNILLSFEFLF